MFWGFGWKAKRGIGSCRRGRARSILLKVGLVNSAGRVAWRKVRGYLIRPVARFLVFLVYRSSESRSSLCDIKPQPDQIDAVPAPASLIIAIGERINTGID